jgi:hypothetical protein
MTSRPPPSGPRASVHGRAARLAEARELARTPVLDPYRGQLNEQPRPDEVVLFTPHGQLDVRASVPASADASPRAARSPQSLSNVPVGFAQRKTPGPAVLGGILGLIAGGLVGIFGLILLALINYEHSFGAPDRSFYQGSDASYVTLAFLDFGVSALSAFGAIRMLMGRVAGRVSLTIATWVNIGFCAFWWHDANARNWVPIPFMLGCFVILFAVYHRSVTRWLGVQPAPQPE